MFREQPGDHSGGLHAGPPGDGVVGRRRRYPGLRAPGRHSNRALLQDETGPAGAGRLPPQQRRRGPAAGEAEE